MIPLPTTKTRLLRLKKSLVTPGTHRTRIVAEKTTQQGEEWCPPQPAHGGAYLAPLGFFPSPLLLGSS